MKDTDLTAFATRYAAAWSSQDPDKLASLYSASGSLKVNTGVSSVGRAQIAATASDGRIVESKGHYDEAEYERQMSRDD